MGEAWLGGRSREWLKRWRLGAAALALAGAQVSALAAASPTELDEHVNKLTSELRCLVCQNQSIADSHSELAVQLKNEVRQQLARGASDEDVRQFMVERYGDFVLYRPPVKHSTWLLWGGPALLLLLGVGLLAAHWRARRNAFKDEPDSVLPTEEAST